MGRMTSHIYYGKQKMFETTNQIYKIREPNSCTCKYKIFENVNYLHCDMILMKPMVRTPSDPSASRSMNESVFADISCISL